MSTTLRRKRLRSTECNFICQSKYFVTEHMQDDRDPDKVKQIHDKTLSLLFKGVSKHHVTDYVDKRQLLKHIRLNGNGIFTFIANGDVKINVLPEKANSKCKSCNVMARVHIDCANCNLELCEFCGVSCYDCCEPLCSNCVNLFGCGTIDKPCCARCKMFGDN